MAWTDRPDWENASLKYARASLRELARLLKISQADVETRQQKHGVSREAW